MACSHTTSFSLTGDSVYGGLDPCRQRNCHSSECVGEVHVSNFVRRRRSLRRWLGLTVQKRNILPSAAPWVSKPIGPDCTSVDFGEGREQTSRASKRFSMRTLGSRTREASNDCSCPG